MMVCVRVSTKIKRELKNKERFGIGISEVLRRALEEEIKRHKLERFKKRHEKLNNILAR